MAAHETLEWPDGTWTCTCEASGSGGAVEAEDHIVSAWAESVGSADVLDPFRDAPPVGVPGTGEPPLDWVPGSAT